MVTKGQFQRVTPRLKMKLILLKLSFLLAVELRLMSAALKYQPAGPRQAALLPPVVLFFPVSKSFSLKTAQQESSRKAGIQLTKNWYPVAHGSRDCRKVLPVSM